MPEPSPPNHPWTPQYAPEVEASLTEALRTMTHDECVVLANEAGALTEALVRTLSAYTETHHCTALIVALGVKELLTSTNRQCTLFLERHRPSPAE